MVTKFINYFEIKMRAHLVTSYFMLTSGVANLNPHEANSIIVYQFICRIAGIANIWHACHKWHAIEYYGTQLIEVLKIRSK